ncbi:uncharacterized protein BX663DRAFT_524755 [Cokeromyces recurvatus]|uniref:uncharacterized protein n=1 Tax=Cokeromyces recurvatus TaxID=90255 RepID=UPI0022203FE7|nr:uncharacterized protein BX663DRAFT_524755 [Cokeromyces recurvatus]KAI7898448.1 hypothetical protein BX663DRAFT_524755 [Cokeromyces recurvatus]
MGKEDLNDQGLHNLLLASYYHVQTLVVNPSMALMANEAEVASLMTYKSITMFHHSINVLTASFFYTTNIQILIVQLTIKHQLAQRLLYKVVFDHYTVLQSTVNSSHYYCF